MMWWSKYKQLKSIRDQVVVCKKCDLYKTRNLPMIGKWNHDADIMFIGEAPWKQEDQTGHPFMGASGKVIDELLEKINLKMDDIYICNVIKCRPPRNRDPYPNEIEVCKFYLQEQIKIISPKIICSLGRFARQQMCKLYNLNYESLSSCHWKTFKSEDVHIVPLYHPAAALYDPSKKQDLLQDIASVR